MLRGRCVLEGSSDGHAPIFLSCFPRQDDFAELAADASQLDFSDILCIVPANDNLRTKERLSARSGDLLRRLIVLHPLRCLDWFA